MEEGKDYAMLDAKKVIEIAIHLGIKFFIGGILVGTVLGWLIFK